MQYLGEERNEKKPEGWKLNDKLLQFWKSKEEVAKY